MKSTAVSVALIMKGDLLGNFGSDRVLKAVIQT